MRRIDRCQHLWRRLPEILYRQEMELLPAFCYPRRANGKARMVVDGVKNAVLMATEGTY